MSLPVFVDRNVQYPRNFTLVKSGGGAISDGDEVTITAAPGTIIQAGTPINATVMNGVEGRIHNNSLNISKGLFTVQAQMSAGLNELSQMAIDVFNDESGIDEVESSKYNYDDINKIFEQINARTAAQKTVTANGNAKIVTGMGKALTANGNVQISTAQYQVGTSSGYFDGTGDYLTVPDSADFDFGTGDFTIRFKYWANSNAGTQKIIGQVDQGTITNQGWAIFIESGLLYAVIYKDGGAGSVVTSGTVPSAQTWHDVAFVRYANNIYLYVDGVQLATAAFNFTAQNSPVVLSIGVDTGGTTYFTGYMDELEIAKGVARYTANFTPSVDAIEPDEYTVLLLHFEGANGSTVFTDSSVPPMLGTGVGYFDGTGDYLSIPDSDDWNFGTGDFTIRFKARFLALPTTGNETFICGQFADSTHFWYLVFYNNSGTYRFRLRAYNGSDQVILFQDVSISLATSYDFSINRRGDDFYFFKDGVQQGTAQTSSGTFPSLTGSFFIGDTNIGGVGFLPPLTGYIDELEIAKGIGRYNSDYTPLTEAIVPDQYTVLLLHMNGTDGSTVFTDDDTAANQVMTLVSESVTALSAPEEAFVVVDETLNTGTTTYYISRDDGTTWTEVTPDELTDISAQPSGTNIKVKVITGDTNDGNPITINAWAFGYR